MHLNFSDGRRHPTFLVAMIVDGTLLPHFPADGNQLKDRRLVDQVSRVMLIAIVEVGSKTGRVHLVPAHEIEYTLAMEFFFRNLSEKRGKFIYRKHGSSIGQFGQKSTLAMQSWFYTRIFA